VEKSLVGHTVHYTPELLSLRVELGLLAARVPTDRRVAENSLASVRQLSDGVEDPKLVLSVLLRNHKIRSYSQLTDPERVPVKAGARDSDGPANQIGRDGSREHPHVERTEGIVDFLFAHHTGDGQADFKNTSVFLMVNSPAKMALVEPVPGLLVIVPGVTAKMGKPRTVAMDAFIIEELSRDDDRVDVS